MPLGTGGNEKKYVNGREIVIKPKQPINIQKKIDKKSLDLPGDISDLRSNFDLDKMYRDDIAELGDAWGKDSFASHINSKEDKERPRQRLYAVYREMYSQIFIKNALNVIKNETAQKNDNHNLLDFISDNQDVIDDANELFFDILDINYELKPLILETCQMGDNFYEIVLDDYENPTTIVHLQHLPQEKMSIIEQNGKIKFYLYTYEEDISITGRQVVDPMSFMNMSDDKNRSFQVFMPWQIVHFKIKDRESDPYGRSLLFAGTKDYRRLALLEDAMLVYRLSRAPERRIFYVDVGQLNSVDAKIFLNKIKNTFKKESIIDSDGNLSERSNVMSLMEDFYIPVREGSSGTKIEQLQAGQQLNEIKDLEYFKDKILRLLNIPLPYIGGSADGNMQDINKSLSSIDIKFANYIEEIQSYITKGLNKILALQLILKKYKNEEIINFKIQFTAPSNLAELIKLDYMNQQIQIAASMKGLQMFSDNTIYKKVFQYSKKEIYKEKYELTQQNLFLAKNNPGGMGAPEMGQNMAGAMPGGMPAGGPEQPQEQPNPDMLANNPPTGGTEQQAPQQGVEQPQMADYDNEIYKLGLSMLSENYEEITVSKLLNKMGSGFVAKNKEEMVQLITEMKTLREILNGEEEEESNKKRKVKNNFHSMVRLGEFNGLDFANKQLKYFRNGQENKIDLDKKNE
jgi:hypothetical protein